MFDHLREHKQEIEERFGGSLTWDRMDGKKSSMIYAEVQTSQLPHERDEFTWFADNIRAIVSAVKPSVATALALLDGTQVE